MAAVERVTMDGGGEEEEEDATDPLVMCEPRELEVGLEDIPVGGLGAAQAAEGGGVALATLKALMMEAAEAGLAFERHRSAAAWGAPEHARELAALRSVLARRREQRRVEAARGTVKKLAALAKDKAAASATAAAVDGPLRRYR